MCGIVGLISFVDPAVDPSLLDKMTDSLAHRGPDGRGTHIDGRVGLGHRRLAIIDLECGKQPLCNEDGSIWLTYNGEIYNFRELKQELEIKGHRFLTNSDTETIVHAYEEWGVNCLLRLRGMFAFALWDSRKEELFVARDRVGVKPLCYAINERVFAFASELLALKTLSCFDRRVNLEALDLYLHFQYIPAPLTIYRGISKLKPAHWFKVKLNGDMDGPHCYWDMKFQADHSMDEQEWICALDHSLSDAVKTHLVSDVPFGSFLSGGVDSSAVTAYMSAHLRDPVRSFHIGYDSTECDETEYARIAAKAVKADFHTEKVDPDALAVLPTLVKHFGEPFADSSAVCTYYVAQAARKHVKMVLSGDGGDETHGGYNYFSKLMRAYPEAINFKEKVRRKIGAGLRAAGLREPAPSLAEAWYGRSPYFADSYRSKLWKPQFHDLIRKSHEWNRRIFEPLQGSPVLDQCQYVDIHNYLVYDNLNKVDIASMAHGLEVRVPLLDHVLLETVARIPAALRVSLKAAHPVGKYLLKRSTEHFFPRDFYHRPKMGFSIPVSEWLAGAAHVRCRGSLLDGGLSEWFNLGYVETLLNEHRDGMADHGHRLWALLFLAEWQRQESAVCEM